MSAMQKLCECVEIPITRGLVALVSAEDAQKVNTHKWYARWNPHTRSFYAAREERVGEVRRTVFMHREILGLISGDGRHGDHVESGNTLDNRRSNLRIATSAQNTMNSRRRSDNTSGLKGIHFHKGSQKWRASIGIDGRLLSLGLFLTLEAAHEAYRVAAIKYHGEFRRIA